MSRRRTVVVLVACALPVALLLAWLRGMRDKDSRVVDWQRRINRDVMNPRALRTAGRPGADVSVLRHTGRRSGRTHRTPLGLVPVDGGFLVGLVYGPRADWVQNVLAAGTAVVEHDGEDVEVGSPRVVSLAEVAGRYGPAELRVMRAFGVEQCLELRLVPPAPAGG